MTVLLCVVSVMAQQQTETIKKEINFEKADKNNVFYLSNINGEIKVEGYSGTTVMVEARKTIKAKTKARLQKGMAEISIAVIDRYDTMIVYMKGPCGVFNNKSFGRNNNRHKQYRLGKRL